MKNSRKVTLSSSSTSTVFFTLQNNQTTRQIPIETPSPPQPPAITAVDNLSQHEAAKRIQSAYKSHIIRSLYKKIATVNRRADELQQLIQHQATVDSIRNDDREKLRMNEALMVLLLKLDSVPGIDDAVREARKKASRRIVGLQEILDAIAEAKGQYYGDDDGGVYWEELAEEEICREKGGGEMERFCSEYLGFRCLQRFLRE